jgi:O-acetylhomoserine/O-acetylserine sulfhydrylase-like pyridoxal-dependent enzyme
MAICAVLVMIEKEDGSDLFQSSCPGNSLNRLINPTTRSGQTETATSDAALPSYLYNSILGVSGYAAVNASCCGTRST